MMNRLTLQVSTHDPDRIGQDIEDIFSSEKENWAKEFGASNVPVDIIYYPADGSGEETGKLTDDTRSKVIWAVSDGVSVKGFAVFVFEDHREQRTLAVAEGIILGAFLFVISFFIYIDRKVIMPFQRLSDYPEKIARNEAADHIPETKGKYFGKFIWGMNMLSDRLSGDTKKLRKLEKEKQTLISTIAHGIKTPVANINLYAEAIRSGLYREDGTPDPKDSEIAEKIAKNADDITSMVKELLDSASKGIVDFEPSVETFYLSEIEEFIKKEYGNRLNVLKIPLNVNTKSRVMIESDRSGLIRAITQLLENAIKYGDGSGIDVVIDKTEDGYVFGVKNKGSFIPDGEAAYIFNSFWRGSNAAGVEGNGLGLYEASYIIRKLGGTIEVRSDKDIPETEFEVFLPL